MSRAEPDAVEPVLMISRVFDAPRELMFQVWTDPQHVARWWGPKMLSATTCEMDLRVGGAYRIVMRAPDGAEFPVSGLFVEIVPPERIVTILDCREHPAFWHDLVKPQRQPDETNPAGILLQTVTFDDLSGQTRLTIKTRFESDEIRAAMVKMGMTDGWSQSLARLGDLLLELSGAMADRAGPTIEALGPDGRRTVVARRHFAWPAERVYDAWLQLGDWMFATPNGQMLRREVDSRLGGRFVVIEKRGEQIAEHYGNFVILERPHRLAFTFRTHLSLDSTLVTIEIHPAEDGCELVLTHVLDPKWIDYFDRVQTGWTKMLDGLGQRL